MKYPLTNEFQEWCFTAEFMFNNPYVDTHEDVCFIFSLIFTLIILNVLVLI